MKCTEVESEIQTNTTCFSTTLTNNLISYRFAAAYEEPIIQANKNIVYGSNRVKHRHKHGNNAKTYKLVMNLMIVAGTNTVGNKFKLCFLMKYKGTSPMIISYKINIKILKILLG